jgi:hypothetical protein
MNDAGISKHDRVLAGLVYSLQAAAFQQLGKIKNPFTDEMERDLEQARGTIDVLEMLKAKCRTDTHPEILRMLDAAVMDLQMNYVEERRKEAAEGQPAGEESPAGAEQAGAEEDAAADPAAADEPTDSTQRDETAAENAAEDDPEADEKRQNG